MKIKKGLEKDWEIDKEANSKDDYSHAVVIATEEVGELLDNGKTPEEALNEMASDDLTGFMVGCLASWINKYHPRGSEFNAWWNKDNQIGTEGDRATKEGKTLNPALLHIETK